MSSPVAFHHADREARAVVHGDDFVLTGLDEELDVVLKLLEQRYEIQTRGRLGAASTT